MNRCRTCKHFIPSDRPRDLGAGSCDSPKIKRGYNVTTQEILPDGALVEDDEGWGIVVAPDFGCVHHEPADTPHEHEADTGIGVVRWLEDRKWIPVTERLPALGFEHLVDVWQKRGGQPGERVCNVYVYHVDDRGVASWQGRYGTYIGRASITHWRPIPGPPEV